MDMSGMDMSDMGSGSSMDGMDMGTCMTHMTGNWQTVGICILAPSWQYVATPTIRVPVCAIP